MEENKRIIEDKLHIAFSTLDEDMTKYSFFPVIYISQWHLFVKLLLTLKL